GGGGPAWRLERARTALIAASRVGRDSGVSLKSSGFSRLGSAYRALVRPVAQRQGRGNDTEAMVPAGGGRPRCGASARPARIPGSQGSRAATSPRCAEGSAGGARRRCGRASPAVQPGRRGRERRPRCDRRRRGPCACDRGRGGPATRLGGAEDDGGGGAGPREVGR